MSSFKSIFNCCAVVMYLLFSPVMQGQDKNPVKFGKVKAEDFNLSAFKFDENSAAVVVSDAGKTFYETNGRGGFSVIFKKSTRIKILSKAGYDAGNISIELYKDGTLEERMEDLEANCYNLNGTEVAKSAVEKKSIFKEKISDNVTRVKFSIPAVKEGAIIEYSYRIVSDFITNIQPWYFQNKYYTIWSEYEAEMPGFLEYVVSETNKKYYSEKTQSFTRVFNITQTASVIIPGKGFAPATSLNITVPVNNFRWSMRHIPGVKPEKFIWSIKRSMPKIKFQVSRIAMASVATQYPADSWSYLMQKLMSDEDFGVEVNKINSWIEGELGKITGELKDSVEIARKIFQYIRDNFTCTEHTGIWLSAGLKNIYEKRSGNVSDINLLLTAMLKRAGFNATPAVLCTRSGGGNVGFYPLLNELDYVLAHLDLREETYFLDASNPLLGFGRLMPDCFNGTVRLVNEFATRKILKEDSLLETKSTSLFLRPDESGLLSGKLQLKAGYYESMNIRKAIKEQGKDAYLKDFISKYPEEIKIDNIEIENDQNADETIIISMDLKFIPVSDGLIYFNPMLAEGIKETPFSAGERSLAVELLSPVNISHVLKIDLPDNWVIDEMPKSEMMTFNNANQGFFEYKISNNDKSVLLQTKINLNRNQFAADEYGSLREFYSQVVRKHNEQIVFKKKK